MFASATYRRSERREQLTQRRHTLEEAEHAHRLHKLQQRYAGHVIDAGEERHDGTDHDEEVENVPVASRQRDVELVARNKHWLHHTLAIATHGATGGTTHSMHLQYRNPPPPHTHTHPRTHPPSPPPHRDRRVDSLPMDLRRTALHTARAPRVPPKQARLHREMVAAQLDRKKDGEEDLELHRAPMQYDRAEYACG